MIDPKFVVNRIQFELAAAIKAANGKLHIDDALVIAGTPCVLVDYANVSDHSLKYISRAMRHFFKRNPRFIRFTKDAVARGLRQEWLPNLEDEEKRQMLTDFKMTPGVDADSNVIYDHVWVDNLTQKEHPDNESYGRKDYTRVNLTGNQKLLRQQENPTVFLQSVDEFGIISAPLDITEEEWYQIICETSPFIKEYLACYIQIEDGIASCADIERMFGISADAINNRNTLLGRRAQNMLNIEVYDEQVNGRLENRRFWSTPMLKGQWVNENDGRYFRWQMRPELIQAAKRLAAEENWDLPTSRN